MQQPAVTTASVILCATLVVGTMAGATRAQSSATTPALTPAVPAPLGASALAEKVDDLLNAHVTVNGFSGAVVLAKDGKPLVAKGYGYANAEWQIPNTTRTKFRIGSITKQFTAMLVMQLREQGKVALEASICEYLAPCPPAWQPVTVHHLLTHTSGIPTYTAIPSWRESNMVPKSLDQLVSVFRDLPLQFTPGERFAYNNSGYVLLGLVIEKASKKKYEVALQDLILTPLGLKDTGYDWPGTILSHRASGYTGRGLTMTNAPALDMQQPYAAGALYSTVEDLLRWDQALYTDSLLPETARKMMWTPFKNNYGFGWVITGPTAATFGYRRIEHGGGINGFSSAIIRVPDAKVTAIVLSNNQAGNAVARSVDLLAIYFGHPYTVPGASTAVPAPKID